MDYGVTIIGAGVVGLACARKFSEKFSKCLVLERNSSFGQETSSRNSEVIHAGIYYPQNSLKAKLSVPGKYSLMEWCDLAKVPYRKIGKFIVAVNETEVEELGVILKKAQNNGVAKIGYLGIEKFKKKEPFIKASGCLWSPETGIIDSHRLMQSLESAALENKCDFAYKHDVVGIEKISGGYELTAMGSSGEKFKVTSEMIINAAGLGADLIASIVGIDIKSENLELNFCRGHYFRINPAKKYLANHLIYPMPYKNTSGLGIHVTKELSGDLKLGPDTEFLSERVQDYTVAEELHSKFYEAASKYIKDLEPEDIYPDQSGIRPKLQTDGGEFRDFYIREESSRGLPGFINLIGIESPGLTCCMEIGEHINKLL